MTREEQIIEAGAYHSCESRPPKTCGHNMHELAYINRNLAFEAGAKWADENPKESKQDIINNAKEFLRINFERGDDGYSCYYPDGLERLLWQFDLWMR